MLNAASQDIFPEIADGERALVARLIDAVAGAGVRAGPIPVVNFYVALKSKPLALLAGPVHSGKIALVESLAQILTGGARVQCQMLVGHAWWAGRSESVALCTEAQSRLNAGKVLALVEEAIQPENANRVYLACLSRISPAEVVGLLAEVALQLQADSLLSLSGLQLDRPVRFPPNLLLTATMDTDRFDWVDAQLVSHTTLIEWPASSTKPAEPTGPAPKLVGGEQLFVRACVRDARAARAKLRRILGAWPAAFSPLARIVALLKDAGENTASVLGDVLVFLANAWTSAGHGLFDPTPARNLAIAADLALAQTLLPRLVLTRALRRQLSNELIESQYSISAAALERFD